MPTTTTTKPHRRQKLRASHEIFSYRPLHQQPAQHDLYAHTLLQLRLSMGKSHSSPNITDVSCIKHSHIKVSAFVSSTSLVPANRELSRRKKAMDENSTLMTSARKTMDHYKCLMGVISFSRNTAIQLLISPFILTGGVLSVLRKIPMA